MTAELDMAMWRKASYSTPDNNCVEIARPGALVGIRDNKAPCTGRLVCTSAAFEAFLARLKA